MSLFYRRALERDLPRWREKGWVTAEGEKEIAAEIAAQPPLVSAAGVFGLIAAALLCLALAAFVAANWDAISRPAKLSLILGVLWTAYGVSAALNLAGMRSGAHAALLLGSSAFGGAIMLISQMYHISGSPPTAVLVWALGALIGGALLASAPTLALAALLLGVWSEMEVMGDWSQLWEPHWEVLPLWGALALAFLRTNWRGGFDIIAIGLCWWIFVLGFRLDMEFGPSIAVSLAVMALGLVVSFSRSLDARLGGRGSALLTYGFISAFLSVFFWGALETENLIGLREVGPYAAIVLGFALATLGLSLATGAAALSWWCYAALIGELVFLYFQTLGTLLDTAAFFALAGLLVVIVAVAVSRLQKRRPHKDGPQDGPKLGGPIGQGALS